MGIEADSELIRDPRRGTTPTAAGRVGSRHMGGDAAIGSIGPTWRVRAPAWLIVCSMLAVAPAGAATKSATAKSTATKSAATKSTATKSTATKSTATKSTAA